MSESDKLFLELQEAANELGFETVDEAKAAGYEVAGNKLRKSAEALMLEAHIEWENKRREAIESLKKVLAFLEQKEM